MEQWVMEKKAEARRRKTLETVPNYSAGMIFTGNGPKNQPVGMTTMGGTPFNAHKGEMAVGMPEGTFILNQSTTDQVYPPGSYMDTANGLSREINGKMGKDLPSFAAGGMMLDPNLGTIQTQQASRSTSPAMNLPAQPETIKIPEVSRTPQTTTSVAPVTRSINTSAPAMNLPSPPEPIKTPEVSRVPDITPPGTPAVIQPQTATTVAPTAATPPGTPTMTQEDRARTEGIDYLSGTLNKTNEATMLEGRKAVADLSARQQQERNAYEQKLIQQGVPPDQARIEAQMLRNQQETDLNNLAANYGIAGMKARESAATNLAQFGLQGQMFEQQKAQYGDTEGWRAYEAAIAAGDFATAASAYKGVTGNEISMDQMKTYQNYINAKNQQDLTSGQLSIDAQGIANEAATLGVDSNRLSAFITAVNNGSDLTAANAASGLNLTQAQMDGITTKYRQGIEAGNIQLTSAKNKLGDEVYSSVQDMINGGSSITTINDRLSKQGKAPLTLDEYNGMRSASTLGQRDWERNLQAFNTLLASNDPANISVAASQFSQLFPGVTFSADQLIKDVGAERFATAMADLSTLANSFDTWDDAAASVEGLNLINSMGIGTEQAKDMFRAMKINTVDEEWKSIRDSDYFKSLPQDKQQLINDIFTAGLTGEFEVDVKPVYNVTDKSGNFVREFGSIADANKFIGENADKEYTIKEEKSYTYKDMGSGETVVYNNGVGDVTETPKTVAARFASAGSDYTEEDIVAFQAANGRLPVDSKEMDAWDAGQSNIAFWNKMEDEYSGGELTTEGVPPKVSSEQYKNLISAYESGDKRADAYFAEPSDAVTLFPEGKNMDQVLADWFKSANGSTENGKMGGYEAMVPKEMRDAVINNIGKLIQSPDGKTYVILGLENYDSKGRTNVGAIKVYNTETRKTEYISPYVNDNPNINSITSDIVSRGVTDNYTDAKKISDYAVANNVTPEKAKEALGI